jgi:hypothetical protein
LDDLLIFKILLLSGKTSGKYYQKLSAQHRRKRDKIAAKVEAEICFTGVQRVYLTDFVPIRSIVIDASENAIVGVVDLVDVQTGGVADWA